MRTAKLFLGDLHLQFAYGLHLLYVVFTILFISLIHVLPPSWREQATLLIIFTDPAAIGCYFMGAIVLFERNERVLGSLAVSPVSAFEYMVSKICSIGVLSTTVGCIIQMAAGGNPVSLPFVTALFLSSCIYSSAGLVIAARSGSLNGFILSTVPFEIVFTVPAIFFLFGWHKSWLSIHPGVAFMQVGLRGDHVLVSILVLLCWTAVFMIGTHKIVKTMFRSRGGVTL